jgi:hypothetical protein
MSKRAEHRIIRVTNTELIVIKTLPDIPKPVLHINNMFIFIIYVIVS